MLVKQTKLQQGGGQERRRKGRSGGKGAAGSGGGRAFHSRRSIPSSGCCIYCQHRQTASRAIGPGACSPVQKNGGGKLEEGGLRGHSEGDLRGGIDVHAACAGACIACRRLQALRVMRAACCPPARAALDCQVLASCLASSTPQPSKQLFNARSVECTVWMPMELYVQDSQPTRVVARERKLLPQHDANAPALRVIASPRQAVSMEAVAHVAGRAIWWAHTCSGQALQHARSTNKAATAAVSVLPGRAAMPLQRSHLQNTNCLPPWGSSCGTRQSCNPCCC